MIDAMSASSESSRQASFLGGGATAAAEGGEDFIEPAPGAGARGDADGEGECAGEGFADPCLEDDAAAVEDEEEFGCVKAGGCVSEWLPECCGGRC
jgi:hypothetical protein